MLTPSTAGELASIGVELETVSCPLCGSTDAVPVVVGSDRTCGVPGRFQVVRCGGCALLRTDPRPTRTTIRRYYPADYAPYQLRAQAPHQEQHWLDRRVTAMPPVSPPGRLLEIGTSFGAFLNTSKLAGWDVTGVEFDEPTAARAAALTGAPVHADSVESVQLEPASFDLICAWQVVEHFHDPVLALRRCFDWLRPGGWLAIAVPDIGSVEFRLFQERWFALELPRHLFHFTSSTCRAMFETCGFGENRLVRPRTIYTALRSVGEIAEERGLLARGNGRAVANSLPARLVNLVGGYAAAAVGQTATFTMMGRKPR
jgi:SAM-dependent methyltransferase